MKKQMITFTTILWSTAFLSLSPFAQALVPPPGGGYPNLHTALGDNALFNSIGGIGNTAVGWYSQWGNIANSFNTSLGAGALLLDVNDCRPYCQSVNTAVGAAALLLNSGTDNTAVGAFALLNNIDGSNNNSLGHEALFMHVTGSFNNAVGANALYSDQNGSSNNAFGESALSSNVGGIKQHRGGRSGAYEQHWR